MLNVLKKIGRWLGAVFGRLGSIFTGKKRSNGSRKLTFKRGGGSKNLHFSSSYKSKPKTHLRWLSVATLILAVYLVFYSPIFIATSLNIQGNHLVSNQRISELAFPEGFTSVNMLTMNQSQIEDAITGEVLQIASVDFQKDIINQELVLNIEERSSAVIWESGGERYLMNRQGVVYDRAPEDSPLVVVEDLKNVPVNLGQKVVASEFVQFVSAVTANLPRQTNLTIRRVVVRETTFEIEVETSAGWRIIFDTTRSWEDQLNKLVQVMRTLSEAERNSLNYVDLRVENKVYYQ